MNEHKNTKDADVRMSARLFLGVEVMSRKGLFHAVVHFRAVAAAIVVRAVVAAFF